MANIIIKEKTYTGVNKLKFTDANNPSQSIIYTKPQWGNVVQQCLEGTISQVSAEDLKGWTRIPAGLFKNQKNLRVVELPEGITQLESSSFSGSSLKKIIIPASVQELNNYPFNGTQLSEVVFKGNPLEIGFCVFSGLPITELNVGTRLEKLGYQALASTQITSIDLPATLQNIGTQAFSNCRQLKYVTIRAINPPSLSADAFNYCNVLEAFYVPVESVEAYKQATNWSAKADKIFAIEE